MPGIHPQHPAPTLDPRPLEHLRRLIDEERFGRMLEMLFERCQQHGELFGAAAASPGIDTPTLRQNAHELMDTTGHAGLKRLNQLSRILIEALRGADPDEIRRQALAIQQATGDATSALRHHFSATAQR